MGWTTANNGRPRPWARTVNIKSVFRDGNPADAREHGQAVAKLLREELGDVMALSIGDETADGLCNQDLDLIALDFEDIQDAEDFDDVLERLYDWADDNRVWLGI